MITMINFGGRKSCVELYLMTMSWIVSNTSSSDELKHVLVVFHDGVFKYWWLFWEMHFKTIIKQRLCKNLQWIFSISNTTSEFQNSYLIKSNKVHVYIMKTHLIFFLTFYESIKKVFTLMKSFQFYNMKMKLDFNHLLLHIKCYIQ